jgi:hypothetical protein
VRNLIGGMHCKVEKLDMQGKKEKIDMQGKANVQNDGVG